MTFQERLRNLRLRKDWSQEELANQLGLSRQAVQKWETGASRPDMDNLIMLSQLFQVSLDWLVTGTETSSQTEISIHSQNSSARHYEYRSKRTLWGLPLVHICFGPYGICRARGIIAIGNIATGIIAIGGLAAGGIALGGMAAGLLSLGGVAVGLLLAFGGGAVGAIAVGGLAIGYLAIGGCALGAFAVGGAALAQHAALGSVASGTFALGERAAEGLHAIVLRNAAQSDIDAFWHSLEKAYPWFAALFRWMY